MTIFRRDPVDKLDDEFAIAHFHVLRLAESRAEGEVQHDGPAAEGYFVPTAASGRRPIVSRIAAPTPLATVPRTGAGVAVSTPFVFRIYSSDQPEHLGYLL
jgi:hypothetical protein